MNFALGLLLGLLTNYIFPPFRNFMDSTIATLFHLLNPNKFNLTGKWEHTFKEPSDLDPSKWNETLEIVQLKQFADTVKGTGETQDDHRIFTYTCKIEHDMVNGSYIKKGEQGNICGTGMIQLMVTPDRLSMKGQATWFDRDTQKIESSECIWKKI
ncbi:MAG: hypothetical protein ABIG64_09045 [Candidatus Omnitrophota bacterium]